MATRTVAHHKQAIGFIVFESDPGLVRTKLTVLVRHRAAVCAGQADDFGHKLQIADLQNGRQHLPDEQSFVFIEAQRVQAGLRRCSVSGERRQSISKTVLSFGRDVVQRLEAFQNGWLRLPMEAIGDHFEGSLL